MKKLIDKLNSNKFAKITERIIIISLWLFILFFLLPRSCDKQYEIDKAQSDKRTYISASDQVIIDSRSE